MPLTLLHSYCTPLHSQFVWVRSWGPTAFTYVVYTQVTESSLYNSADAQHVASASAPLRLCGTTRCNPPGSPGSWRSRSAARRRAAARGAARGGAFPPPSWQLPTLPSLLRYRPTPALAGTRTASVFDGGQHMHCRSAADVRLWGMWLVTSTRCSSAQCCIVLMPHPELNAWVLHHRIVSTGENCSAAG